MTRTALPSASRWPAGARAAFWAAALLCVYGVARVETRHLLTAMAAVIAVGLVLVAVRHPLRVALLLVTALPFDLYGTATLYRVGVPASVLRPFRFWPEMLLAALGLAALGAYRKSDRRLDALDKAALVFAGIGTLYLLFPRPFVAAPVGAHLSFYVRALSWRTDVMYVVVFLVARRLPIKGAAGERILRQVVAVGTVVAALGLFEFAAPGAWDRLAAGTLQVPKYQLDVLHALPIGSQLNNVEVFGHVGSHSLVRVGSVLDYESLGFYLALCLGACAELWARGRAARWMPWAFAVLALGLFVTQTRSGILAGVIAVGFAFRPRAGISRVQLRRLAAGVAAVVAIGGGLYVFGHTGSRLAGDSTSNSAHVAEVRQGVQALFTYPLGRGLATAGPQYKRSALSAAGLTTAYTGPATGIAVTDDQWLAIGTELGLLGLAAYVVMCALMIRRLGRARSPGFAVPAAARNALVGILVGGTFLQPFISESVSLTLFLLAGVGLPALAAADPSEEGRSASVTAR